jgi:anti-anti-sigma regulatory factor
MLDIERTAGAGGRAFRLVGDLEGGVLRQLQRILSGPASDGEGLTVDLSGLDSCDVECARLLVTLTKRARIAEGDLVLTAPSAAVLEVLTKVAGTDELNIVRTKVATKR